MQSKSDQSKITALRKTNRLRNATPDRLENRLMDTTATSISSPRRKNSASGRQSVMSQTTLNSTALNLRKMELEHNNLELELVYGEYIQSMAELVIANKKLKETEASYGKSIKNLSAEVKSLEEKCHILEERNNNIKLLSSLNNYEEVVQAFLKETEKEQKKYELQSILLDLEKLLSRFNVLRCEKIQLPSTSNEIMEFKETLKNCLSVLKQIGRPVECETLENLATHTEEFAKVHQEISQIKKIVEEEIFNLQSEVLHKCSKLFSSDHDH